MDGAQAGWFDDPEPGGAAGEPTPPRSRRAKVVADTAPLVAGPAQQLEIDLGPTGDGGLWRLPSSACSSGPRATEIDRGPIEEGGQGPRRAPWPRTASRPAWSGMTVGPTVTRYELELGPGVKVARVTSLHKDIAYAMARPTSASWRPIPGTLGHRRRGAQPAAPARRPRRHPRLAPRPSRATHPLEVAIGRDIAGRAGDGQPGRPCPTSSSPGATGAGKSSCINSLITSMLDARHARPGAA